MTPIDSRIVASDSFGWHVEFKYRCWPFWIVGGNQRTPWRSVEAAETYARERCAERGRTA